MASELKVNKITPESGVTLTLGDSGDTINFGSGVLPNFENLTVTGDLTVDTNSLKVDSTNNFVGIGTASPTVALDVVGAITATGNITGTLATAAQPNITSLGTLTGLTTTGNVNLGDNDKAQFGDSNDLQIYHDGSDSIIDDLGTGNLQLRSNGTGIYLQKGNTEYLARFTVDQGNEFYYNNSKKLETTSTGIDVTGTVVSDGLTVDTNTLYVNSTNNRVGIGTSSPDSYLANKLVVATSTSDDGITIASTGTNLTHYLMFADGTTGLDRYRGAIGYNHNDNSLRLLSNGSERMRIDSSGRVGIGETSMDGLLVIKGDSNSSSMPSIRLKDGADSREAFVSNQSGDLVLATTNSSDDAIDSAIKIYTSQMIFFVDNDTERMRIDSSGDFMIGTTSEVLSDNTGTGSYLDISKGTLQIKASGNAPLLLNRVGSDGVIAQFRRDGVAVGSVSVTSSGTTYNTTSDYRLKDNIEIITDGTERLMKLKPVRHSWKESSGTVDGFLAHEVQEAGLEYAVTGEKDGKEMQSMDYGRITPILVSALQNAINEINDLKKQIQKMESK